MVTTAGAGSRPVVGCSSGSFKSMLAGWQEVEQEWYKVLVLCDALALPLFHPSQCWLDVQQVGSEEQIEEEGQKSLAFGLALTVLLLPGYFSLYSSVGWRLSTEGRRSW